jgi:RNA polymerase sigma-32 factor
MSLITNFSSPGVFVSSKPTQSLAIDNFQAYFAVPLLSEVEEQELTAQYYENQSKQAAHKLVLAHMRYVVKISKNYLGYGLPLNDLVQEGSIGLMKAIKKFDPNVGVRLVSFATYWIKSEIHEFIIKNWHIVKIATTKTQRKLFFNLRKLQQKFTSLPKKEQEQQIATELELDVKDVQTMHMRMSATNLELDKPLSEHASAHSPQELLADPSSLVENDFIESSSKESTTLSLHNALESLSSREKEIVEQRFLREEKTTLDHLSDKFGVSIERIRQIEKAALKKLELSCRHLVLN